MDRTNECAQRTVVGITRKSIPDFNRALQQRVGLVADGVVPVMDAELATEDLRFLVRIPIVGHPNVVRLKDGQDSRQHDGQTVRGPVGGDNHVRLGDAPLFQRHDAVGTDAHAERVEQRKTKEKGDKDRNLLHGRNGRTFRQVVAAAAQKDEKQRDATLNGKQTDEPSQAEPSNAIFLANALFE
jgi:hypothetical protein